MCPEPPPGDARYPAQIPPASSPSACMFDNTFQTSQQLTNQKQEASHIQMCFTSLCVTRLHALSPISGLAGLLASCIWNVMLFPSGCLCCSFLFSHSGCPLGLKLPVNSPAKVTACFYCCWRIYYQHIFIFLHWDWCLFPSISVWVFFGIGIKCYKNKEGHTTHSSA